MRWCWGQGGGGDKTSSIVIHCFNHSGSPMSYQAHRSLTHRCFLWALTHLSYLEACPHLCGQLDTGSTALWPCWITLKISNELRSFHLRWFFFFCTSFESWTQSDLKTGEKKLIKMKFQHSCCSCWKMRLTYQALVSSPVALPSPHSVKLWVVRTYSQLKKNLHKLLLIFALVCLFIAAWW